jgi:hypothetical protein
MQAIAIIKLLVQLLPVIIEAVRAIEAALPASGQGAAKLAILRETLGGAFELASDLGIQFERAWPAIERTVGAVVALMNKTAR